MGIGFVLQLWLALRAPAGIDPWVAWVMVAASAAGAFSTVTLQLPIRSACKAAGFQPFAASLPMEGRATPRVAVPGWKGAWCSPLVYRTPGHCHSYALTVVSLSVAHLNVGTTRISGKRPRAAGPESRTCAERILHVLQVEHPAVLQFCMYGKWRYEDFIQPL